MTPAQPTQRQSTSNNSAEVDDLLPTWTTLSVEHTSDEEESPFSNSTNSGPRKQGSHPLTKVPSTLSKPPPITPATSNPSLAGQAAASASNVTAASSRNTHNPSKRASSSLFDLLLPPSKKANQEHSAIPGRIHRATQNTPTTPTKGVPYPSTSSTETLDARRPSTQDTHSNIEPHPSPRRHNVNSDSRLLSAPVPDETLAAATATSAPARPQRKAKALPPITEDSDIAEWKRVDVLLDTHVAPSIVLPKYAQRRKGGGAKGQVHVAPRVEGMRARSKGKQRAAPVWTETRWSNVGEFKERLDTMFGPGAITRGLGRAPKNVSKRAARDDTTAASLNSSNQEVEHDADDAATLEDEGETVGVALGNRRGRLERRGL